MARHSKHLDGTASCVEVQVIARFHFAGNPNTFGALGFPNITQANLSEWSNEAIAEMLSSGFTPDSDRVGP